MIGKGQFRFSYFTGEYEATVSFYRDDLQFAVLESWDRSADDRGTLFAAASGIIEVLFRPENKASFHGWDDRPPSGRVHGDRSPGRRTGIPEGDGETAFDPRKADHAAVGASQLLPSGAERTHNLRVQRGLAGMRPNNALRRSARSSCVSTAVARCQRSVRR
jgi:hypothetical protein